MKNWLETTGSLLLGFLVASVVSAQSSTAQSPSPAGSPRPQVTMTAPTRAGGYTATFTGCVEKAPRQAASGESSADGGFLLTGSLRGTADNVPVPVGTAGRASEGPQQRTYKLDAPGPTITPHVGRQAEVTGLVTVVLGGTAMATADGALAALSGTPQVKVEKIRTIAETCAARR